MPEPQPVIRIVKQTIAREKMAGPTEILLTFGSQKSKRLTRRRGEEPYVLIAYMTSSTLCNLRKVERQDKKRKGASWK